MSPLGYPSVNVDMCIILTDGRRFDARAGLGKTQGSWEGLNVKKCWLADRSNVDCGKQFRQTGMCLGISRG